MKLEIINPVEYPHWDALLLCSNNHSFFHTSAWAKALESTYRYRPLYFAIVEEGNIALLMPMMEVRSPFQGKRGVSLPFTDFCTPQVQKQTSLPDAVQSAIAYGEKNKWRYIEWRAMDYFVERISAWTVYFVHEIDLVQPESILFSNLKSSNQRNIRKAIRERVNIKIDHSFDSVKSFYRLNCITRKRHGLPSQPFLFFENVFEHVLSKGYGAIVSASYEEKMIAASVFFHFGRSVLFKYGASEMKHQHLRPNNLIMWEAIKWYKSQGFKTMHLGRSAPNHTGLLQYKRTWGAKETLLEYYRYDLRKKTFLQNPSVNSALYNKIFARTPIFLLRLIGSILYKHVG